MKLKDVIVLSDSNLGLVFENHYIYYDIFKKIIVTTKELGYKLEHPKRVGKSIVALTENKKMLLMLNEKTGYKIGEVKIEIEDKYFGGEFEIIIFKET